MQQFIISSGGGIATPKSALNRTSCNGSVTDARDSLEEKYTQFLREHLSLGKLVSYVGNKRTPLLRLYRYKEAFALEFVRLMLKEFAIGQNDLLLDPFAGMGTTLFAAWCKGIASYGIDRLPIAAFVARTLPSFIDVKSGEIMATYRRLLLAVDSAEPAPVADDVRIIPIAFPSTTLLRLRQWKSCIQQLEAPLRDVMLLLFYAILEEVSYTSKDGQFLRLNRNRRPKTPDVALRRKCEQAEEDLQALHNGMFGDPEVLRSTRPQVWYGDTCAPDGITFPRPISAIITSPPYLNRYDYTRTYCLELCLGFVRNFSEMRDLRHSMLRSHIESRTASDEEPCHEAVEEVITALRGHTLNNARIPFMVMGYFTDMKRAIGHWSKWVAPGAFVALVVDNVRFHGEHIPVDLILSDIAAEYGFNTEQILITRYKGNSSQQMGRWGRIPVRESVVIWRKQ